MRYNLEKYQKRPDRRVPVALSKVEEPRALITAWFALPELQRFGPCSAMVLESLSKGMDPMLPALIEFDQMCAEQGIEIMVKGPKGPRPFKIEATGTAYYPSSKVAPARFREAGTTKSKEFWDDWNRHRAGVFAGLLNEEFRRRGTTLDEYVRSFRGTQWENGALIVLSNVENPISAKQMNDGLDVEALPDAEPLRLGPSRIDTGLTVEAMAVLLEWQKGIADKLNEIEAKLAQVLNLNTNWLPLPERRIDFGASPAGGTIHMFEIEVAGKDEKAVVA